MTNISADEIKRVKGLGFLWNRGTDEFSMRVITENGVLTAAQLQNISETALKFGNGKVAFTTRMTVELPGIPFEKIEEARASLAKAGMVSGGTGAKVRPVVACKGTTCVFGKLDTQAMATEIHKKFFEGWGDVPLPHKFKIAVGGCPNNCIKPDLNDFGVAGQLRPHFDDSLCRGCKKCQIQAVCPMGAPKRIEGEKIALDPAVCTRCGRCVGKCPFKVIPSGDLGMKVYVGGRWGKSTRHGSPLDTFFTTNEQVFEALEKTLLLFRDLGLQGERLGETVDRLGLETVKELLAGDSLLARKSEILAAPLKTR